MAVAGCARPAFASVVYGDAQLDASPLSRCSVQCGLLLSLVGGLRAGTPPLPSDRTSLEASMLLKGLLHISASPLIFGRSRFGFTALFLDTWDLGSSLLLRGLARSDFGLLACGLMCLGSLPPLLSGTEPGTALILRSHAWLASLPSVGGSALSESMMFALESAQFGSPSPSHHRAWLGSSFFPVGSLYLGSQSSKTYPYPRGLAGPGIVDFGG